MQKVVIDTNVIVSSLIQHGYPYLIIYNLYVNRQFELCVSDQLILEYYEVLARPKFQRFQDFLLRAVLLLAEIEMNASKYFPTIRIDLIKDADDNMILELADECKADFIITGNTTDFTFPSYKQTKIVTPKDYWENHQPN